MTALFPESMLNGINKWIIIAIVILWLIYRNRPKSLKIKSKEYIEDDDDQPAQKQKTYVHPVTHKEGLLYKIFRR